MTADLPAYGADSGTPADAPTMRRPLLPVVSAEAQALAALLRLDGDGRAVAVDAIRGLTTDALGQLARAARRLADLAEQEIVLARSLTEAPR